MNSWVTKMFDKLLYSVKVQHQILLLNFFTIIVLVGCFAGVSLTIKENSDDFLSQLSNNQTHEERISTIFQDIFDVRLKLTRSIGDTNYFTNHKHEVEAKITGLEDSLGIYANNKQSDLYAESTELLKNIKAYSKIITILGSGNDIAEDISKFSTYGDKLSGATIDFDKKLRYVLAAEMADMENEFEEVYLTSIGLLVCAAFLIIFLSWILSAKIVQPIGTVMSSLQLLANGDLSVHIKAVGKNELYALAVAFNQTVDKLRAVVTIVNSFGDRTANAATDLREIMQATGNNANTELHEIDQVTTAVTELASSAVSVNEHAKQADITSKETDVLARDGMSVFKMSHESSSEMAHKIKSVGEVVVQLKNQSLHIDQVVEVIRSISEQTNLLALNAAIEAARAGETGRGFAVVADEVRMLAGRTEQSTKEIQTVIAELQVQAESANDSMTEVLLALESTVELNNKVNTALSDITASVRDTGDLNDLVSIAAQEQSEVTSEVNRNLTNISDLVQKNVKGISNCINVSTQLSELAESQKKELNFFKIPKDTD